MNRKHNIEEYLQVVSKLKKINSEIKFSSDFIIGYPGETKEDFNETLKLKRSRVHKYLLLYFSPRPGTPAASMKKISDGIAKERLIMFQKTANEIKMNYRKNFLIKNH